MTRRGKFVNPRAQKYLASKDALAFNMKSSMALNGFEMIPGQTPFSVMIVVHHTRGHQADLDNILKAILDAGNGVLYPDDRWCDLIRINRGGRKTNDMRIVVKKVERKT